MSVYFEQFDKGKWQHHNAASGVYSSSVHSGAMTPIRGKDMAAFPYSLLAFEDQGHPGGPVHVGHIAVVRCEDGLGTIGGLVVGKQARRQGAGLALAEHLLATAKAIVPDLENCQAFANEASLGVFLAAGGVYLGERSPVSPTGCNSIMDLTPALEI